MLCSTRNVSNLTEIQAIQKGSHHFLATVCMLDLHKEAVQPFLRVNVQ